MLETKLELAATELINNKYTKKFNLNLESLAELLLNMPYFKKFVGTYGDVGPLTFIKMILLMVYILLYQEKLIFISHLINRN